MANRDFVTGEVTLVYPDVFVPRAIGGKGAPKFSVTALFDPEDATTAGALADAVEAAFRLGVEKGIFKDTQKSAKFSPVRDGNEKIEDGGPEFYRDKLFIAAKSSAEIPPEVCDLNGALITDASEIYSGVKAKLALSAYPYDTSGNKGIALALDGVLKVADGKQLQTSSKPSARSRFGF